MNSLSLSRCALSVCVAATSLAGCGGSQQPLGGSATSALTPAQVPTRFPTEAELENWRSMILRAPKPEHACLVATYPERVWRETPCVNPRPNLPHLPAHGMRGATVGNGTDYSAILVKGHKSDVSFALGSFQYVTGVKSEWVQTKKGAIYNLYSLQLNTNTFTTETCKNLGSKNPRCQGWEQFYYSTTSNGSAYVQIEYWLLNYGVSGTKWTCPIVFWSRQNGTLNCTAFSNAVSAPLEVITQLPNLSVYGQCACGTISDDGAGLFVGLSAAYEVTGDNWFPDLGHRWNYAEFNVFGDSNGDQADFNAESSIAVRTEVDSGVTTAPNCAAGGQTGETNNLFLTGQYRNWQKIQYPSIAFAEIQANPHPPKHCVGVEGL